MGAYEFPNGIGAIDGSHIWIEAPHVNPNSYFNRKRFHSVVLQGVCIDNLSFISTDIGWPGKAHDAKVLRRSLLWNNGYRLCYNGHYHLVGDAAYPLRA